MFRVEKSDILLMCTALLWHNNDDVVYLKPRNSIELFFYVSGLVSGCTIAGKMTCLCAFYGGGREKQFPSGAH